MLSKEKFAYIYSFIKLFMYIFQSLDNASLYYKCTWF